MDKQMNFFTGLFAKGRIWKPLAAGLIVTAIATVVLYTLVRAYVISQAEKNIQNLMLSHRGIHHYIQQIMHPTFYRARDRGDVAFNFYSPEIFSSSFIVRNQHKYYNMERKLAGLPEVYYKLAADNPRNPVNKADTYESRLIKMFNDRRDLRKHREIIELNGKKYLYYALPFLTTAERCLKCHGERKDAPLQLQKIYKGMGGFRDRPGNIRAIESIRAPLEEEFSTVYIASGALLSGFISVLLLILFNRRLGSMVKARTVDLENEVSERRAAEESVRKLNEELEDRVEERTSQLAAANKELDAFAYSVSHDLRAPLRSIDGFSQALEEDYTEIIDHEGKDYLKRIRAGCIKMSTLIDDMLKLSRLTRGNFEKEDVDLSAIAEKIVQGLRESDPHRNVEFTITPGISAQCDMTLIQAVLENLIGNAWKFTGKKDKARITFGYKDDNARRTLFIKDNGAGFNMQYANKLFNAFQRLHSPQEFEGTGIGLATVQRIINRHGGKIWADSVEGEGATFYFQLS